MVGKIWNSHFWSFQIYTSLFGKIVRKNLEQPFLAILNFSSHFGKNCWYKFGMAKNGHSKFSQSFWEKLLETIWNNHFCPFGIYPSLFGKNCQKKFGMAIFGQSSCTSFAKPLYLKRKHQFYTIHRAESKVWIFHPGKEYLSGISSR